MKDRSRISDLLSKLDQKFFNKTFQSRKRTKIRGAQLREKKRKLKNSWETPPQRK